MGGHARRCIQRLQRFLAAPLVRELSSNHALVPLLRVATMLHGRPSTLHAYDSSNAYGPAMRIPSTRSVHQGCVLGGMFFTILSSRRPPAAQRRRPRRGCARRPVGIPSPPRGRRWKPRSRARLSTVGAKRADNSIRRISIYRESHVPRAFGKIISVQYRHQDLPLGPSDMSFRGLILITTVLLQGGGACTT
jgi:hypothetical protein